MPLTASLRFASVVVAVALGSLSACGATDPIAGSAAGAAGQGQAGGASGGASATGGSSATSSAGVTSTAGAGAGGAGGGGALPGAGAAGVAGTGGAAAAGGAAGGAGAGGAGGAGMAPYNPCPTNGDPCRVMPLGDSITWGAGSSNLSSYRATLFHLSLANNKKLTFVGSAQDGPDMVDNVVFPKHHEGHSGWTIDDGGGRSGLYPQIQTWLTNTPPDIVTLMIGTNDVDISLDLNNAPKRLGLLLDRIGMYAPKAMILVAQIVPTTDDTENQRTMAYNVAIPALVKSRADAGKHVALVDMYGAFTKNANYKTEYMTDKLHPKDAGYTVMAQTWWTAIAGFLPSK